METLDQIKLRAEQAVPGLVLDMLINDSPSAQHSLRVNHAHAVEFAQFLRDDRQLRLDYVSNMAGVDWPDTVIKTKVKKTVEKEGKPEEIEETMETPQPGYLEAVYHLYSMQLKHGPVIIRLRTENRTDKVSVPSLTPVWRGAEFQEREVYDLYGIQFTGHPDLRRILMWEEFKDYPMRKDYVEPDDYDYEPTPHDDVVAKAKRNQPAEVKP